MTSAPIAVIGNANLDLVGGMLDHWPEQGTETFLDRSDSRIGGSAANTGLVLQRLGAVSGLIASAGSDMIGDMIRGAFNGPLDRIANTDGASSVTFGLLHGGAERSFFSTPGHLDAFGEAEIRSGLTNWPLNCAWALLSGSFALPLVRDKSAGLLARLRDQGAKTAIDPGWPDGGWTGANRDRAWDWVGLSDLVLLNDKELLGLTGQSGLEDALASAEARLAPSTTLIVKCGPDGAVSLHAGQRHSADSPAAGIFDTIGAGDAFNAGYLAALQAGYSAPQALHAGCNVASAVIREFPRGNGPVSLPPQRGAA